MGMVVGVPIGAGVTISAKVGDGEGLGLAIGVGATGMAVGTTAPGRSAVWKQPDRIRMPANPEECPKISTDDVNQIQGSEGLSDTFVGEIQQWSRTTMLLRILPDSRFS